MYDEDLNIDKQADWLTIYKMDPITVGRMCEKFPALQIAWSQFKTTYEMCKAQDEANRQIP
jgi:hypothetical protein